MVRSGSPASPRRISQPVRSGFIHHPGQFQRLVRGNDGARLNLDDHASLAVMDTAGPHSPRKYRFPCWPPQQTPSPGIGFPNSRPTAGTTDCLHSGNPRSGALRSPVALPRTPAGVRARVSQAVDANPPRSQWSTNSQRTCPCGYPPSELTAAEVRDTRTSQTNVAARYPSSNGSRFPDRAAITTTAGLFPPPISASGQ